MISILLISTAQAETLEIARGLFFNPDITEEASGSCGDNIPGTECIIQCCSIENTNTTKTF